MSRIKIWLQNLLKSWVFDGKNPNIVEHKIIHVPTNTIVLRTESRWNRSDIHQMIMQRGMSESQIFSRIKEDLIYELAEKIKTSGAIEFLQVEEPYGLNPDGPSFKFGAVLRLIKTNNNA